MAKVVSKGSLLKVTISASLTTVAQASRIGIGATRNVVVDAPTLDDAAFPIDKVNTGDVEQAPVTATIFYDPDSSVHQFITDTIALGPASFPLACSVVFADATPASATFNAAGFSFSATMANRELLGAEIEIEVDGAVSWPT